MAQWIGQFSGLTHATKVQDIEASLRLAVAAYGSASDEQRSSKAKSVRRLAERLLGARIKALHARLSVDGGSGFQERKQELCMPGVAGILQEFGFDESFLA